MADTKGVQAKIDALKKKLTSGGNKESIIAQINKLRASIGKKPLSSSQVQRISSGGTEDDATDTSTGLTKDGKMPTKTDEELREQSKQDVAQSRSEGEAFGNYIGENSFKKIESVGKLKEDRSDEMKQYLSSAQQNAAEAKQLSASEQDAQNLMRQGVEGYNSQEVQAMREKANEEIDRNSKTAQYQQGLKMARAGVSGGAALAGSQDLAIQAMEQKRATERDLVVQNAQEAQSRKAAYANLVGATEAARWGRTGNMQNSYGSALAASDAATQAAAQFNITNQIGVDQFNATQATNEELARAGIQLQGAGIAAGQLNTNTANNIAARQYNSQLLQNQQYQDFVARENAKAFASQEKIAAGQHGSTINISTPAATTSGSGNTVGTGSASGSAAKVYPTSLPLGAGQNARSNSFPGNIPTSLAVTNRTSPQTDMAGTSYANQSFNDKKNRRMGLQQISVGQEGR